MRIVKKALFLLFCLLQISILSGFLWFDSEPQEEEVKPVALSAEDFDIALKSDSSTARSREYILIDYDSNALTFFTTYSSKYKVRSLGVSTYSYTMEGEHKFVLKEKSSKEGPEYIRRTRLSDGTYEYSWFLNGNKVRTYHEVELERVISSLKKYGNISSDSKALIPQKR